MGQVEVEIPVAPVLTPFQHGKPFVTEEEEKSLGMQIFNLHKWYLRMTKGKCLESSIVTMISSAGKTTSGCTSKIYHIYHRQALDVSIITIWVL